MMDSALVRELRFLGIAEQSWPVLTMLPLIQVAWADGSIQPAEHALILRLASDLHLDEDGARLIETWLTHPPSERYLLRGRAAMHLLASHYPHLAQVETVLQLAQQVAEAAGGLFGLRKVSPRELQVLAELNEALSVPPARRWDFMEDLEDPAPPKDIVEQWTELSTGNASVTLQAGDGPASLDGAQLLWLQPQPPVAFALPASGARIGRSRVCDLWIRSDSQVSRHHALIHPLGETWRIQDNASATGTWVNGERVVDRRLFGGEEIRIGHLNFRFRRS